MFQEDELRNEGISIIVGWIRSIPFRSAIITIPRIRSFALRVMNEDTVAPGQGFGMHGHRDMEIVTCVLSVA